MTSQVTNTAMPLAGAERGPVMLMVAAGLVVAGLVALDTGVRGVALFALGGVLGAVFLGFQFGFASAWRRFLTGGEATGLTAHFLLIGLCALVFLTAPSLGLAAAGSVAPVSVSLVIGAFIFGIGMQLANGCGSGVLFSFGGGSGRMMVALPFFVIGSLIGSFLLPAVLDWGSLGQVPIAIAGNAAATTGINLALIALVGGGVFSLARRRGEVMPRWLVGGTVTIAVLCWLVFALSGHPWGVTFGFTLWGAKIASALGVPVESFAFWQWPGPRRALEHSVLADVSSLMDFGIVLGAGAMAAASGGLRRQDWPPFRQLAGAALGGLLMGIGARLGFGCNIGAFLAGIASGSLHGWIWFAMAMAGSWVGVRARPRFGLAA